MTDSVSEVAALRVELAALQRQMSHLKSRVRDLERTQIRTSTTTHPLIRDIVRSVCEVSGETPLALISERRAQAVLRPRQVACWLARRFTRHSLPKIGICFERDHTSILHAVRRVDEVVLGLGQSPVLDTPEAWARLLLSVDPWPRALRHA